MLFTYSQCVKCQWGLKSTTFVCYVFFAAGEGGLMYQNGAEQRKFGNHWFIAGCFHGVVDDDHSGHGNQLGHQEVRRYK